MTRALVLSEHDLDGWRRRYAAGEVPAPLPYGVDALETVGWQLRGVPRSAHGVVGKARDVVEHRTGLPVERALRGVPAARGADVVLALLEREGMAAARWKGAGLPPYASTPLVIWSCWLADDIDRADAAGRRRLRRRIEAADLITHMSRWERSVYEDLGIPTERLVTATFGVSHRYYTPDPDVERDIDILSVGQDRGRDYATLFEAVRGTGAHLEVYSKAANIVGLEPPAEVRANLPVSLPSYRQLLRRATIVAVPTHDLWYPTGQSVALEAAAVGCCVVVTGTRAMQDYFVDGETARLVEVGDVVGWRQVLTELREDPEQRAQLGAGARRSVEQRFNADVMWTEIADVVKARGLVGTAL